MTRRINLRRLAGIAVAAFLASLAFGAAAHAQDLPQELPLITFNSGGTTTFANGVLRVDAFTIDLYSADPEFYGFVLATTGAPDSRGTFTIRAHMDGLGRLVPGVAGDGLFIGGSIDMTEIGRGVVSGDNLLTGELRAIRFIDKPAPATDDEVEFRFSNIGGLLAPFFQVVDPYTHMTVKKDVGVRLTIPASTFTGTFTGSFGGRAQGAAFATPAVAGLPPPGPPVLTLSDVAAEATSPGGAVVSYTATAVDGFGDPIGVNCAPASGSLFPLGETVVNCASDPDIFEQVGEGSFTVTVRDTTAPILLGDNVEVDATSPSGAKISLPITACNFLAATPDPVNPCNGLPLPVTCTTGAGSSFDPATEYQFAMNTTTVNCSAIDPAGNTGVLSPAITVTVNDKQPPAPREGCFIVDFREITYFRDNRVIMSSDADIRTRAGIAGLFDPAVWPYRAGGGLGYTASRGTQFRIYGFRLAESGQVIPDADDPWTSYVVKYDAETKGYYADLGGPARVIVCAEQLHEYVLSGKKGNGHKDLSTVLPQSQRNVPGIMLSHNSQIVKLPKRVRAELYPLGLDVGPRGLIDYIGFQLQGNGSGTFREFVDVEVSFPSDSATDLTAHYTSGFHTASNSNFESFAGCNYVDHTPGNDSVRLRDVWGPNRSKWWSYNASAACGSREPSVNQKQRANYDVAFNAIQILPTVSTGTDTLRLFYGQIAPIPESERGSRDHKVDWSEWDRWDR
jgi:hypothetical protein